MKKNTYNNDDDSALLEANVMVFSSFLIFYVRRDLIRTILQKGPRSFHEFIWEQLWAATSNCQTLGYTLPDH